MGTFLGSSASDAATPTKPKSTTQKTVTNYTGGITDADVTAAKEATDKRSSAATPTTPVSAPSSKPAETSPAKPSTPPSADKPTEPPKVYYTPDYIGGDNYGGSYDPTGHLDTSPQSETPGGESGATYETGSGTQTEPTAPVEQATEEPTTPTDTEEEPTAPQSNPTADAEKALAEALAEINVNGLDHVDISGLRDILSQIEEAQKEQSANQIDYAVEQGVNELTRALEDAQRQYQTERDQISIDEQRALDNQALYAQARGDRGGIAAEQYNSIQNTAATNRYRVNQEQTKLATDTARQVADLRAKGEFDKADAVMQITQNYLSNLMELEKYALSTNMSVDQFNAQLEQWKAEQALATQQYLLNSELSRASLSGVFSDGTSTLAAKQAMQEQLASAASAMISLGIEPAKEQLDALGWTPEQYTAYKVAMEAGQLQNIDPRSLPVYWTNSATGQLEQIDNATYWQLLNGNDMGNYKADGSASGAGTGTGVTPGYEQSAADEFSKLLG